MSLAATAAQNVTDPADRSPLHGDGKLRSPGAVGGALAGPDPQRSARVASQAVKSPAPISSPRIACTQGSTRHFPRVCHGARTECKR